MKVYETKINKLIKLLKKEKKDWWGASCDHFTKYVYEYYEV